MILFSKYLTTELCVKVLTTKFCPRLSTACSGELYAANLFSVQFSSTASAFFNATIRKNITPGAIKATPFKNNATIRSNITVELLRTALRWYFTALHAKHIDLEVVVLPGSETV